MRRIIPRRIYCIILTLVGVMGIWGGEVRGQTLYEDFNYTVGQNIGGNTSVTGGPVNNWYTHSNSQPGTIDVTSGSLSYPGLQAPSGNKVRLPGSNSTVPRDVNRAITTGTVNVAYFSALINILDNTQLNTTGDYFMHFGATSGSSVTSFGGRLGIKSSGTGFRFAIQNTAGGTPTFTDNGTDLTFGTTYFVVVKYDRSVSPTVASLWVNPSSMGGAEPAGQATNSSGTGTFATFASICLRNTTNTPKADIDEIRVGTTWASVTPTGTALTLSPSTLSGFTYLQGSGPSIAQTYTLSGSNLTGFPENITVTGSADYEVSADNATFSGSISVPFSSATLAATTIYVRLKAGLSAGNYNNELIANSGGGASTTNVSCSGSVTLAGTSLVAISQLYGGGGNTGAQFTNDFIELYNRGTTNVDLSGWSVQYASASGTTWQVTSLTNFTLAPGQYYLVQEAYGGAVGSALPTPDAIGLISMSATAGKVALANNSTPLTGSCPTGGTIVDFVGYGAANCYEGDGPSTVSSNTTSVFRAAGGCQDTDHNIYDFSAAAPNPRNTSTTISSCPLTPTLALYNATLNGLTYTFNNGPSASQVFRISGKYLTGYPGNITVTGSTNYQVSLDNTNFFSSVLVPYSSATLEWTPVYVRLKAGLAIGNYNGEIITNSGGGATTFNVTCSGSVSSSPWPIIENFIYSVGELLTTNGWTVHSGSTANQITVSSASITYSCYQSSGIGNEVSLTTTGQDVNIPFPVQTLPGVMYASFLVNATSAQSTGDYFAHFGATSGNTVTSFGGRVWIKKDPSSPNFAFGISKSSTDANVSYTPFIYSIGTTYLVVVKYKLNTGPTNDVADLFINPVLSATEPSSTISTLTADNLTPDPSDFSTNQLASFCLRQGTTGNAPELKLDGIRISTNWADIATPTPTPALTAADEMDAICYSAGAQTTSLTYSNAYGSPIQYNIDWNYTANLAGLADQGITPFTFQQSGGIISGIAIPGNVPAGTYNGTLTLTNITGCTGTLPVKVTVNAIPTVLVTPPGEVICNGGSVILTASGADTYSWSPITGLNQTTGAVVTASPAATTNYTVTGTINSCSSNATATVSVMESPVINLVASPSQCAGTKPTFTASPTGYYYEFFLNNVSQGPPSTINTYTPSTNLANGDNVCVTAYPIPPLSFDGTHAETVWSTPLATSAGGPPTSGFEPNRLDALYLHSIPDYLIGFLAGNLVDGGTNDRILMFIDCQSNGYNTLSSWTNRSNAPYWSMENLRSGTVFDVGFTPEFILGINRTGGVEYFNLYNMTTNTDNFIGSTAGTPLFGFTSNSGTGDYSKGFEFAIPLSALGNPTGTIKVFPMIVDRPTAQGESVDPTYLSNQFLTRANSGEGNYTDAAVDFSAAAPDPVSMTLSTGSCTSQACLIIGNQWTGAVNSNWSEPGNWCTGIVPNSTTDVVIANVTNQPTIALSGTADCRNLEIQAGATITIESDATNSGSLIINGSSSGTGTITYNRYLETNKWYILSSPVNNSSNQTTFTDANLDIVDYKYNIADLLEASNTWNYRTSLDFPLINGKGYLAKLKASASNTVSFTGTPNNTLNNVAVQSTGTYLGWNAVGNPFTSALKISDETTGFLDINSTKLEDNYAAIYLWSANASNYITISKSAYTPKYGFSNLSTETAVQAGQGFLINVKKPQSWEASYPNGTVNRNITFNGGTGGMQVHSTGTSIKRTQTSWPGITLLASSGGRTRSTIVAFHPAMTTGLDPSYDAGLLSVSDFNVYTSLVAGNNETSFTIQCLPDNQYDSLIVPVGLDMPQAGLITFKADGVILPDGVYPVIEDRLDQISTPLKTSLDSLSTYLAEPGWGTGRFYLHFGNTSSPVSTDEQEQQQTITASYANQEITVFGAPEAGSIARLYDVNGRMLGGEYRLTSDNINRIPARKLKSGIYLLLIDGKTYRQTLKITVLNPG